MERRAMGLVWAELGTMEDVTAESCERRGLLCEVGDDGANAVGPGGRWVQSSAEAEASTGVDSAELSVSETKEVHNTRKRPRQEDEEQSVSSMEDRWDSFIARADIDRKEKIRRIAKDGELDCQSKGKLVQRVYMQQCAHVFPEVKQSEPVRQSSASVAQESQEGCVHYKRKCRLVCPCCVDSNGEHMAFTCRFCHDQYALLGKTPHRLNRYEIEVLECTECDTRQPVAESCRNCKVQFSKYSCLKCKLFDDTRPVYHCDKCGLCRVGQAEDNHHCDNCNACISKESFARHVCVENALKGDCPICKEGLYESREKVVFIRCGHALHRHCLSNYLKWAYRCPICFLSMANLRSHTIANTLASAAEQLPEVLKRRWLKIYCYECRNYSTIPFTFYPRCTCCKAFNTRSEGMMPEDFKQENSSSTDVSVP